MSPSIAAVPLEVANDAIIEAVMSELRDHVGEAAGGDSVLRHLNAVHYGTRAKSKLAPALWVAPEEARLGDGGAFLHEQWILPIRLIVVHKPSSKADPGEAQREASTMAIAARRVLILVRKRTGKPFDLPYCHDIQSRNYRSQSVDLDQLGLYVSDAVVEIRFAIVVPD